MNEIKVVMLKKSRKEGGLIFEIGFWGQSLISFQKTTAKKHPLFFSSSVIFHELDILTKPHTDRPR